MRLLNPRERRASAALAALLGLGLAVVACGSAKQGTSGSSTGSTTSGGTGAGVTTSTSGASTSGGTGGTTGGTGGATGTSDAGSCPVGSLTGWTLVWSDEFCGPNGSDVD